jgi:hypothetical protein
MYTSQYRTEKKAAKLRMQNQSFAITLFDFYSTYGFESCETLCCASGGKHEYVTVFSCWESRCSANNYHWT